MKPNALLPAAVALFTVIGCGKPSEPAPPVSPAVARSSLEARWVPLRAPEKVSFLELPATVLASAGGMAALNPPYPGQIVKMHTRVGDQVKRGQPVVDIMMPAVVAAAGEQAAAHTKIEAYLVQMQQLTALKSEGLARAVDLADVQTRLAEARADARRAEATLRSAGVDPKAGPQLAAGGGAVPLRSPIDGVVTEITAALGETRDSAGTPFARIAGTSSPRIEARASQKVPAGARFELVTGSGDKVALRLVGEAPNVESRDGTMAVWFEPEVERSLPAGLTGRVRVVLPTRPGLTIAPHTAVGNRGADTFVRARRGDAATEVRVKVLQTSGADVLIESTLLAGAEIAERAAGADR